MKREKNRIEFTTNCIAISEIPMIKCTDSALKKSKEPKYITFFTDEW